MVGGGVWQQREGTGPPLITQDQSEEEVGRGWGGQAVAGWHIETENEK